MAVYTEPNVVSLFATYNSLQAIPKRALRHVLGIILSYRVTDIMDTTSEYHHKKKPKLKKVL